MTLLFFIIHLESLDRKIYRTYLIALVKLLDLLIDSNKTVSCTFLELLSTIHFKDISEFVDGLSL